MIKRTVLRLIAWKPWWAQINHLFMAVLSFCHYITPLITPSEIGLDLFSPLELSYITKVHLPSPMVSPKPFGPLGLPVEGASQRCTHLMCKVILKQVQKLSCLKGSGLHSPKFATPRKILNELQFLGGIGSNFPLRDRSLLITGEGGGWQIRGGVTFSRVLRFLSLF